MAHKYFGTDGIRGTANSFPITPEIALRVGQAVGQVYGRKTKLVRPTVVIGKDTRLSGYMVESALQAGLTAAGFYCLLVGPLPTPAVAMLIRSLRADLGIMITASHNKFEDNGIKIFGPDGIKLPEESVYAIEELVDNPEKLKLTTPDKIGKAVRLDDAIGRYTEFCKTAVPKEFDLNALRVVVDCAHGAAYKIAPKIFWELGAQVIRLGCEPDGFNINRNCGATAPETMQKAVVEHGAQLGIALDGDGDRLILSDELGNRIDGDQILAALATHLHKEGKLNNNGVVGTVMSNMGLEKYLESLGLHLIRTPVGDHHVERAMREKGYNLGGESSGHIILSDYTTTGDGILAALQFLTTMREMGKSASALAKLYEEFPQKLHNVKLHDMSMAESIMASERVQDSLKQAEENLNGAGRVLLRKSGTEPVIRVMVEAETETLVDGQLEHIVAAVETQL